MILLSAQGQPFSQSVAQELSATERVVILCGRYEGIDERVNEMLCDREISIGDYVLSGGELAAAVIVDAVVRLLPGALGNPDSSRFESFGAEDVVEDSGEGGWAAAVDLWRWRVAGLSALHAACGFYGQDDSGGALGGQSRGDPKMAEENGVEEDAGEPSGPVGEDRDRRGGPRDSGRVARRPRIESGYEASS